MATPTRGEERIEIGAPPERVYDLVADLTRMGEWSPECNRVEWVGDKAGPAVGSEFKGHNHIGPYRWSVGGKVVVADPGHEFAFTTYVKGRESTRWRYHFESSGAGTAVTEAYEFVWATLFIRLGNLFMPRQHILRRGAPDASAAEGSGRNGVVHPRLPGRCRHDAANDLKSRGA